MAKLKAKFIDDFNVTDVGTGNGSTVTFTLSQVPRSAVFFSVFINGLRRKLTTDFTVNLAGPSITFTTAPATAQEIEIEYWKV